MRKAMAAATVAGAVLAPTLASAAPQTLSTTKVAGGSTAVASCGALSGISVSWTSQANVVTKVVLGSIPAACNGGSLFLTLVAADNSVLGTAGPVTVNATTATLSSITGTRTATSVSAVHIVVVGP